MHTDFRNSQIERNWETWEEASKSNAEGKEIWSQVKDNFMTGQGSLTGVLNVCSSF